MTNHRSQYRRLSMLLALLVAAAGAFVASGGWRQRLREESAQSRRLVAAVERARAAQEQSAARRRDLANRLEADPHNVEDRLELAQLLWSGSGPAAAAEVLRAAPPDAPDPSLARLLAGAQRLMGREDLAHRTLERGIRVHPGSGDLHAERAMLFALLGWFPDARQALRQAERHGAEPRSIALVRATMARQQGDHRAARRELEAMRGRYPEDSDILRQLAAVAEAEDRDTEAIRLLAELAEQEADPEAWVALARMHLRGTDPDSRSMARDAIDRALALRPELPSARLLLGRWLRLAGDREQSRTVLERLHRERPRMASAAFELAQIYRELGQRDRAAPLLTQHQESVRRRAEMRRAALAVMTRPDSASAHRDVGRLCLERGLLGRAIASLERARSLDPDLPGVQAALTEARRSAEAGGGEEAPSDPE